MKKLGSIIIAALMTLGSIGAVGFVALNTVGCGGTQKIHVGNCHAGRVWVPAKKTGEDWKAGFCKDN